MKTRSGFLVPYGLLLLASPGLAQDPRQASDPTSPQEPLSIEPAPLATGSEDTLIPITFEGFVLEPDGAPAEGAVVVSSAGGKAVTDWSGSFRFEALVPLDAQTVQVTAVGRGGKSRLASSGVPLVASSGRVRIGSLQLTQGSPCSPSWLPTFPSASTWLRQPSTPSLVWRAEG